MELKPINMKRAAETWLKLHGWQQDRNCWSLPLGPDSCVTCTSLGMAIDHQLAMSEASFLDEGDK